MINPETEILFRRYVNQFVRVGRKERADFERVWQAVINDADVQDVIQHMLFLPHPVPDHVQGKRLIKIIDHLHGQAPPLELYEDLVITQAEIVAVRKKKVSEGPIYMVRYTYGDKFIHEREYGYDAYHAAACGWGEVDFDAYWTVGRRISCHYRASEPHHHAICEP